MLSQEERWLLKEKYGGEKSSGFFADCERLAAGEPLGYVIGWVPFLGSTIYLDDHPLIPRPETEYWVEHAIASIRHRTDAINVKESTNGAKKYDTPCTQDFPSGNKDILVATQDCPSGNKDILDRHDKGVEGSPGQHRSFLGTDRNDAAQIRVLDLCAGSGCIGVAVARHVPEARVDFAEVDSRLLPTIEKNLLENVPAIRSKNLSINRKVVEEEKSTPDIPGNRYIKKASVGVTDGHGEVCGVPGCSVSAVNSSIADGVDRATGLSIIQSDVFSNVTGRYDLILSNPPYIDPALDRTEPSVKDHEPHRALYGGTNGLACIERIIAGAPAHLLPSGELWIEHEPEQTAAIQALATHHGFVSTTHPDQYGVERYSVLVLE